MTWAAWITWSWLFGWVFAGITLTIITSAVAERVEA